MYGECAKLYDTPLRDRFSRQCFKLCHQVLKGRSISPPAALLDLGCGTGLLAQLLQDRGFAVTGVDLSEEMLRLARARSLGQTPEYLVGDIRTFQRDGAFRAAFCFGDVLNHLLEESDLESLFASVFASLSDGGVFIADTTTLRAYQSELWDSEALEDERDGLRVSLQSSFDQETRLGWIRVTAEGESGKVTERMNQRYHPEPQVEALLKEAGFETVIRQDFQPLPSLAHVGVINQYGWP